MRAHPLPEARAYADLMLSELRKVIPSFLKRVDLDDRGVAWSTYLASTRESVDELAADLFPDGTPAPDEPSVQLTDWRSEEHTSELQSLMRISYAVFCLKKKNITLKTAHLY